MQINNIQHFNIVKAYIPANNIITLNMNTFLDNRSLFIKLVALHDVHSVPLVLFLSRIHKQHYCRKCLKFHLWPPITREPSVRFTWESVPSSELIEVCHIPKIDQLLFRYLFSPKISTFFARLDLCPFNLGVSIVFHAESKNQNCKPVQPS